MVLLLTPFFVFYGGAVLGQKISTMCVYDLGYWYLQVDCFAGTALAGLILLLFGLGVPLCALLLLVSFILYIIAGKKPKLAIPTMVVTGLTVLCTILVVGSLVILAIIQAMMNMVFFIIYTFEPVYNYHYYYGSSPTYLDLTQTINDAVLHGLLFLDILLSSIVLLVPVVTFILALVFGIVARKKAKKEQLELAEEQPVELEEQVE